MLAPLMPFSGIYIHTNLLNFLFYPYSNQMLLYHSEYTDSIVHIDQLTISYAIRHLKDEIISNQNEGYIVFK